MVLAVTLCATFHIMPMSRATPGPSEWIINPLLGQYANYSYIAYAPDETILWHYWLNTSYHDYVEPDVINATRTIADILNPPSTGETWLTINLTDRWVLDGNSGWENTWYWDWIETSVTIGSTVNVYTEMAEVVGLETVEVNVNGEDRLFDCWVVNWTLYDSDHYMEFYDVQTGLVVYQIEELLWEPGVYYYAYFTLVSTNIPVGEPTCIPVDIDVKPGSWPNPLNKGSLGRFAVAICGTEELDVTTIDPSSIELTVDGLGIGVSQLRWSYEDVATPYSGEPGSGHAIDGDGYLDLVLRFVTQEVVNTLELCQYDNGEVVPLTIIGNLAEEYGGTLITGEDYVKIIESHRGGRSGGGSQLL